MNYKVIIVLSLAFVSFVNNLVIHFDTLQEITEEVDVSVFYIDNGGEGETKSYLKTLAGYLIYFVFYYDVNDPLSVLALIGYGG